MTAKADVSIDQRNTTRLFRRGFLAMLPLWAGAIPFGIAYSVAAREAGMDALSIQLMSLTVFSAAAQISAVSLMQLGAAPIEILITAVGLNVHLPLFGAVIARELHLSPFKRLGTAYLLTDATYAVCAALGPLRTPVLIGAGASMFLGWNLGTLLGLLVGQAIPDPRQVAIDFVVPLTFLAVLIPLIRTRIALIVAALSAVGTLILGTWLPIGFTILVAGVSASLFGAQLSAKRALATEEEDEK
jgi:predicted branched-subunit amino acid permease